MRIKEFQLLCVGSTCVGVSVLFYMIRLGISIQQKEDKFHFALRRNAGLLGQSGAEGDQRRSNFQRAASNLHQPVSRHDGGAHSPLGLSLSYPPVSPTCGDALPVLLLCNSRYVWKTGSSTILWSLNCLGFLSPPNEHVCRAHQSTYRLYNSSASTSVWTGEQ